MCSFIEQVILHISLVDVTLSHSVFPLFTGGSRGQWGNGPQTSIEFFCFQKTDFLVNCPNPQVVKIYYTYVTVADPRGERSHCSCFTKSPLLSAIAELVVIVSF